MRPLAHANRHDTSWLIDEIVPSEAAVVDDVILGFEDAVRQPVVAYELPDVLDRIELDTPNNHGFRAMTGLIAWVAARGAV